MQSPIVLCILASDKLFIFEHVSLSRRNIAWCVLINGSAHHVVCNCDFGHCRIPIRWHRLQVHVRTEDACMLLGHDGCGIWDRKLPLLGGRKCKCILLCTKVHMPLLWFFNQCDLALLISGLLTRCRCLHCWHTAILCFDLALSSSCGLSSVHHVTSRSMHRKMHGQMVFGITLQPAHGTKTFDCLFAVWMC